MRLFISAALLAAMLFSPQHSWAQTPASASETEIDGAQVVATVERFYAALSANDVATVEAILSPEGVLFSGQIGGASDGRIRHMSNADWLASFRQNTADLDERTWNSFVLVRGPVAIVWQSYNFEREGAFSHCGINALTLLKRQGEWRIATLSWTDERTACPD